MGKSALMMTWVWHIALKLNIPVGIFSLEMSEEQLEMRLKSIESQVYLEGVRTGNVNDVQMVDLEAATSKIKQAPIYIDDTPGLTTTQLRARALEMKQEHGVELIFIDYLQLMNGSDKSLSREQTISEGSRTCKHIAKELSLPFVALAQLSRAVETRGGDKRPILSDLRESGAIEQDADIVMFLYRAEYYKKEEYPDGTPTKGMAEIVIAKHRHGALKDVFCKFKGHTTTFLNKSEQQDYEQIKVSDTVPF